VVLAAKTKGPRVQMSFPPPMERAGSISKEELLLSAQRLLPKGAFLGPLLDERYTVISHEWLEKSFVPFYRDAIDRLLTAVDGGARDGADCDDFGLFLRQMAGLSGIVARSSAPAVAQVIVFQGQWFSGIGRTRERHAVGLFLTDRGWYVIEPQNADTITPIDRYANRRGIQYITFH
jgi:hypothetical protein